MLHLPTLLLLLTLFTLLPGSLAVDIILHSAPHASRALTLARCPSLPPGTCCRTPRALGSSRITFLHLSPLHIAATWSRPHFQSPGPCSGSVLGSRSGPGEWTWDVADGGNGDKEAGYAYGASYIALPAGMPPDEETIGGLKVEGVLGLVWGGGKWFASPVAERYFGRIGGGSAGSGKKRRRGLRSREKGKVYARSPLRAVWPRVLEINGAVYTIDEAEEGEFMFTESGGGRKMNLTEWFV